MRPTIPSALALASAVLVATADAQRGPRGRHNEPVELHHFTHALVEIDAPHLESKKAEIGVYLPAGYDDEPDRRYPWVLWLHGMNEDAERFHYGGGANALDHARAENRIPDLVFVAPSAPRRTIYADGERAGDVASFVLEDVQGFVEKSYRVIRERSGRAIMGVSMGGMGALRFALREPERFAAVAVHSAAAFPPDPTVLEGRARERVERSVGWLGLGELLGDPIDPEKWARYIPSAMASKLEPADLKGLRIFFDAGTDDRYGFAPPNQEFHELLEDRGIEHRFVLVEGGGHSWGSGSMHDRLIASLSFVGEAFGHAPKGEENRDGAAATPKNGGTGAGDESTGGGGPGAR